MHTDRRELHRQPARELHPALGGVHELRHIGVARVEGAVGVDDADDGPRERIVRVAKGLDEGFAQEEREVRVAVVGEPLAEAGGWVDGAGEVVVC